MKTRYAAFWGALGIAALMATTAPECLAANPPPIDMATGKIMSEAIEYLNAEDYNNALATLNKLKMDRLSPYERSRVEQIFFQIAYQQEKYEQARQHLLKSIQAGGLNEQEISQNRYYIAQLYMQEEQWAKGAAALEEWFRTTTSPNSAAYYMLAIAYYQQNQVQKALAPAKKAVEMADQPLPSWLELLIFLYIDQENYKAALPLLERLTAMDPKKKNNWVQLSSIYQQLEQYPQALAAMQIAYEAGLLTQDSDYQRLADLLAYNEIPYRCAQVLEKGMKDKVVNTDTNAYRKLADCWTAAREFDKALAPLEEAAQRSSDGDLYVRLAEVNMQREDWDKVTSSIRKALGKGKLKDTAYANLLMGVALYNQNKYKEARTWFEQAQKSERHRKTASAYIQRIKNEASQRTGS
jgi:tetratricopeptide (TPR) repeat protein